MPDRKTARREPRGEPRKTAPRSPGFRLGAGAAAVVLTLLVVMFFHEVSVGGKTFVSPDATAPAGFVRMGELSLNHEHVYPLWNPFVFLGMPSFASGAYNPLIYPPDWPLALVQKVVPLPDMTWLLIYYALGAWFVFLLAREWGARPEGALLGAAAFVFAPNLVAVGSHGHGSQLVDSAYLPLMLWLASRWLRRGSWQDLGLLALAGGFQMLRGHVQICFYTWLAVGLYALVVVAMAMPEAEERGPRLMRAVALGVAAALAFGIAGFYNLPLQDYARWSIRGGGEGGGLGMQRATQWSLAPYELPTIAIPAWTGFGGATYWGGMPFTDYPNAYVGMVTLVLALPAFLAGGAPRVFALALGALALFISFGHFAPFYGFLYRHLPLFNKFRIPVMVILLFQLAAALGLAWGWTATLGDPARDRSGPSAADGTNRAGRVMLVAAAAMVLLFVVGIVGQDAWRAGYLRLAQSAHPGLDPQAAAMAFSGFTGSLIAVSILGALAAGLAWFASRRRLPPLVVTALALALLLGELWPVSGSVMKPVIGEVGARDLDAGRDDVVEFLEHAGPVGSFRVLPAEPQAFQDNRLAGFGISSLGGYHAAKPRLFQQFLDSNLVDNLGWMRLLNLRYVLLGRPLEQVPPFLKLAHQGAGGVLYENLLALPRVTVVGSYRVVTDGGAILDSVKAGTSDAANVTFLEADPHLALGPVTGATAAITSYGLNRVAIEVNTPGPALVRLADLWYPDWIARVDGRETPVLQADHLLRAVAVPAGRHQLEFEFRSPSLQRGLMLSLVSFALTLALIAFGWVRGRRSPAAEGRAT